MSSVLDRQPAPVGGTGDVWSEIITASPSAELLQLYMERRQQGIDTYGTPLQRDNGRDHLADAVQELADAVVYFQAARAVELSVLTENLLTKALQERTRRLT